MFFFKTFDLTAAQSHIQRGGWVWDCWQNCEMSHASNVVARDKSCAYHMDLCDLHVTWPHEAHVTLM